MPFSENNINKPHISVIVPCFNQSQYLSEALNSVLVQTYKNWECIIINDGSTDDTENVAKIYIDNDSRFRYIKKTNGGLSTARNKGIQLSEGEWIQFLDADDTIEPTKFEKHYSQIIELGNIQNAIIWSDYKYGQEENIQLNAGGYIECQFKTQEFLQELIIRWEDDLSIPCHCFLINSHLFKGSGIFFDETLSNHEDFDFWLKVFNLNPKVLFLNEKLCTYRVSKNSMSKNMNLMGIGFLQVLNNHIYKLIYPPKIKRILIKKRREILKTYNLIDRMTIIDKIILIQHIFGYYIKRTIVKTGLKRS